jgi:hypothetical protein
VHPGFPPQGLLVRTPFPGPDKLIDWVEIHATQSDKFAKAPEKE